MNHPALKLVDTATGELHDAAECRECARKDDQIAGLNKTITQKAGEITALRRDKAAEARASDTWPVAERLFEIWKRAIKNRSPKSVLTYDRFVLIQPFLRGDEYERLSYEPGPPRNAVEECAAAIIGRVHDHYSTTRTNGTTKHYWEWDRIFGAAGKRAPSENFAESRDRRPRDWRDQLRRLDPLSPRVAK